MKGLVRRSRPTDLAVLDSHTHTKTMKYSLYTDKIELTDTDRQMLEEKLNRLEKHVNPPYTLDITVSHSTHHRTGDVITCKMNLENGKNVWHVEETGETIQNCIDQAIEALQQQVKKFHEKHLGH